MLPRKIWFITFSLLFFYSCPKSSKQRPMVALTASHTTVTRPCPSGPAPGCSSTSALVQLSAIARNFSRDTLLYTYTTTGGRITGDGQNVIWDLSGVQDGTYTATVEVEVDRNNRASASITVQVTSCQCLPGCPGIDISCLTNSVPQGTPATASVSVSGRPGHPSYHWTVSPGTITSGQGTPSITINTNGLAGQNVTATVEIGGAPPECQRTTTCSFSVTR
jgi:hypothetical protein